MPHPVYKDCELSHAKTHLFEYSSDYDHGAMFRKTAWSPVRSPQWQLHEVLTFWISAVFDKGYSHAPRPGFSASYFSHTVRSQLYSLTCKFVWKTARIQADVTVSKLVNYTPNLCSRKYEPRLNLFSGFSYVTSYKILTAGISLQHNIYSLK
jgi:hypothetical protein